MLTLGLGARSTWRFAEKTIKSAGYPIEWRRFTNCEYVYRFFWGFIHNCQFMDKVWLSGFDN